MPVLLVSAANRLSFAGMSVNAGLLMRNVRSGLSRS